MDTRGVFGTRASKLGGPAQPGSQIANGASRAPGVRAAKLRSGGEELNRGVIRGAKQGSAPSAQPGISGRRGGTRRDEDGKLIHSDYEEEGLFNVDQHTVPGVIRGWTPQSDQQHTAGPAFGERPGKFTKKKNKYNFDDDDW
jgi:hypothetical protein